MSLLGRWSTSGSEAGNAHFFTATRIRSRGPEKIEGQTNKHLGLAQEQKVSMQHYISHSIYGLTLAWITSENSTKQLECRHLDSIFFARLYLLCYCVRSRPHLSVSRRQLLFSSFPTNSLLASRYLFRPRRDFKSKNPLSRFAPKQTKESSAWRATYIVLQLSFLLVQTAFTLTLKFLSFIMASWKIVWMLSITN